MLLAMYEIIFIYVNGKWYLWWQDTSSIQVSRECLANVIRLSVIVCLTLVHVLFQGARY